METKIRKVNRYCFLLLLFTLLSCSENYVWEKQKTVENSAWRKDDVIIYVLPVTDTVNLYNIWIDIRNRTDYPFSNIYLFVTAESPVGGITTDTVNYKLAEENGEWKGKGCLSQLKSNRFIFRKYIRFPVQGNYFIKIRHGMRKDTLKGISNVGLGLEHTYLPIK